MEELETGRIDYTGRGFDQDAQERMGGRVESAFVELITNADDSYSRLSSKGQIRIEVERRRRKPTIIRVKDRAEGMSLTEMKERLIAVGGETSGRREGFPVSGSRGRGAKEVVAFGLTTWESIKDGCYQCFRLAPSGDYKRSKRPSQATVQDRRRLGIERGNGTMVTIEVQTGRFPVPQHESLKRTLSYHFRLRLIMEDTNRRVTLVDSLEPQSKDDRLIYRYPEEYYASSPICDVRLPLPEYQGAEGHLQIWRRGEPFDENKRSPQRQGGILVTSGRDVHQITLFRYEHDSYADRFFGRIDVPYIAKLSTQYDDCLRKGQIPPGHNPMPVLRVDHSLNPDHPFTKALTAAVEEQLKPLVDQERESKREARVTIEDEETERRLRQLSRAMSRFFAEKMQEMDEPLEAPEPGDDSSKPFAIIPPTVEIAEKEKKYLTVRLLGEGKNDAPIEVAVALEGEGGIVVSPTKLALKTSYSGQEQKTGTLKVTGVKVNTYNRVVCRYNGYEADAVVQVVEKPPAIPPSPDKFAFERDHYFVVAGKAKRLKLLVPEHLRTPEPTAQVTSDHQEIVVKKPRVSIKYAEDGYGIGTVIVEGRQVDARGKVKAVLGDMVAETTVRVVSRELKGNFPFKFETVNESFGPHQRARWEPPESYSLEIAGRHPSVARYLGPADKDFPGKTSLQYRVLRTEIVADSVCRKILTKKAEKRPDLFKGATIETFYNEHDRHFGECVQVAHRMMLSDAEARSFVPTEDERPE